MPQLFFGREGGWGCWLAIVRGRNVYINSCSPSLCEDANSKWLYSFLSNKKPLQGRPKTHLPNVDGRVEAIPHVHHQIGAEDREVSSEGVHLHLAAANPVAIVAEHPTLASVPVEVYVWRAVESLC